MSKVKHLLRKFHIGGGGGGSGSGALNDHHPHHRRFGEDRAETTPLQQQQASTSTEPTTSASPPSTVPALESSENASNANATANSSDFGLLEEEFQVQLALAISVSDRDSREDPETAQIKAAKQISLGCPPSQSLVDFISLKYWTYNVVNYDEKVMDGFYDVHGLNSNLMGQEKMPMLVDLQSISLGESVNYQVFLVNSAIDTELRKLVERVQLMPLEYSSLEVAPAMTDLVQKIAGIVVDRMGGPVDDAEEMVKKWRSRSYELRMSLKSVILPLGCLDIGLSRHRALLFKVLADQINLPCKLVKGSYYTGSDDGAVDLIKFSDGSEYMIDLMGAPGALIPSEIPSFQYDITSISSHADAAYLDFGSGTGSRAAKINPEPSFASSELKEHYVDILGDSQMELISRDFGKISLLKISEGQLKSELEGSAAQHIQAEHVSENVANVAGNPEITSEGSRILNFPDMPGQAQPLEGEVMFDSQGLPLMNLSKNDQAIIPFTGMHLFGNVPCSIDENISSKLLAEQKDVQRSFFNFSSNAAGPRNDLRDIRADPMINIGNLLENLKETGLNDQSNSPNVHNEQVDAVLGDVAEWEIPWEDLQIGERIGIGSYGEVHRAEWNGTEVAVKKFMNQDISGDALVQFRCEIEIMLRLRHPNLVLFMGAVTRPPNLSILTEYLPRGSLFKLLHRSNGQIDEKRRLRMAIDVAKGMNYLHTSHPTIVHRDLKSPNLLVDKNWVVKVCDFGMSRLKHHTFLSSKSTAGTAEWMAPEVLRNEPCNEKSDVYSFGVILWELATLEVPWMGMNSMQVVGAVGFQGRNLKIPDRIDPMVADLINDCWDSIAPARPSFAQILTRLKCLQHLTLTKEDIPVNQP